MADAYLKVQDNGANGLAIVREESDVSVTDLKNAIIYNVNYDSIITTAYQGGFSGAASGGNISSMSTNTNSNRIRTFDGTTGLATQEKLNKMLKLYPGFTYRISVSGGYKYAYQVWNSSGVGTVNFAFTSDSVTITPSEILYFGAMLALTSDASILPVAISNMTFEIWNDLKNGQVNDGAVTLPFTFPINETVYKKDGKYFTTFKPQKYYYKVSGRRTVFISPDGSDANNGETVLTPRKTLAGCMDLTPNTIIFLPGTYVCGTHFAANYNIPSSVNFIGIGDVVIDNNGNNAPLAFVANVYCENIHFKSGNNTVISRQTTATNRAVFYRCEFSDSNTLNGLSIQGGYAIVVECVAHDNAYDGFNYHAYDTTKANTLEVNCKAYNNGKYNLSGADGQSSNGSTSHDDCPIVRVNGEYYACHGGIVADKECFSANYGCTAGISTITDNSYPDRKSNYWSSAATMYLYDCVSYGSTYDTARINSGTIISNVAYNSNYPS